METIVFGLPPAIVDATLGGIGVEQVAGLESKVRELDFGLVLDYLLTCRTLDSRQYCSRQRRMFAALWHITGQSTHQPTSAASLRKRFALGL